MAVAKRDPNASERLWPSPNAIRTLPNRFGRRQTRSERFRTALAAAKRDPNASERLWPPPNAIRTLPNGSGRRQTRSERFRTALAAAKRDLNASERLWPPPNAIRTLPNGSGRRQTRSERFRTALAVAKRDPNASERLWSSPNAIRTLPNRLDCCQTRGCPPERGVGVRGAGSDSPARNPLPSPGFAWAGGPSGGAEVGRGGHRASAHQAGHGRGAEALPSPRTVTERRPNPVWNYLLGRRSPPEDPPGQAPARVVIDDGGNPPAERPDGRQGQRRARDPEIAEERGPRQIARRTTRTGRQRDIERDRLALLGQRGEWGLVSSDF